MKFDLDLLDPSQPPAADDPVQLRREQFALANASLALEGMNVDAADLEIQEAVAAGALTSDEAVALYLERARKGARS